MEYPDYTGPAPHDTLAAWGESIAAGTPTPGGGSAAAVATALAAGLAGMVARLAASKASLSDAGHFHSMAAEADELRAEALRLAEEDWKAVSAVFKVMALPRTTPEAKGQRQAALEKAWADAATVPMQLVRVAARVALLTRQAAEGGHRNSWGDAVVGAMLAAASAHSASLMLELDLQGWSGGASAEKLIAEAKQYAADAAAEAVRLRGGTG